MSEDMIERVRDAITPEMLRREDGRDSFDWVTAVTRAAIEAMREPTEAMEEAGHGNNFGRPAYAAWQAMIDAALKDTPRS